MYSQDSKNYRIAKVLRNGAIRVGRINFTLEEAARRAKKLGRNFKVSNDLGELVVA